MQLTDLRYTRISGGDNGAEQRELRAFRSVFPSRGILAARYDSSSLIDALVFDRLKDSRAGQIIHPHWWLGGRRVTVSSHSASAAADACARQTHRRSRRQGQPARLHLRARSDSGRARKHQSSCAELPQLYDRRQSQVRARCSRPPSPHSVSSFAAGRSCSPSGRRFLCQVTAARASCGMQPQPAPSDDM